MVDSNAQVVDLYKHYPIQLSITNPEPDRYAAMCYSQELIMHL